MRHGISGNTLNRKTSHRKATVRDIAKATLICQRISTTKAKAKEARKLVDKLITLGKKGTLAHKRRAFAILCNHKLVSDLFNTTAPRFKNRLGGYTRIIPLGNRRGDNAHLVFLELTEKEQIIVTKPKSTATAKATKDIDVKPVKSKTTIEKEESSVEKESSQKKTSSKSKSSVTKDSTGKSGEKFFSGVRKMFNRKTPQSGGK